MTVGFVSTVSVIGWTALQLCREPETSDLYPRAPARRLPHNPKPPGQPVPTSGAGRALAHLRAAPMRWHSLDDLCTALGLTFGQAAWGVRYLRRIGVLDTRYVERPGLGPRLAQYRLSARAPAPARGADARALQSRA